MLNTFALQAVPAGGGGSLAGPIQAAPHLYITAAIALLFKAIAIPVALHHIVRHLAIHRTIETAFGVGLTMIIGVGW